MKGFRIIPVSIKWKISILILLIGITTGLSVGIYTYIDSIERAKETAKTEIEVTMAFVQASREYVRQTLRPKINELLQAGCTQDDFILEAQSSSFFTASIFNMVTENLPEMILRQVAFNPLNPKNEPNEVEKKIIAYMRSTNKREFEGIVVHRGQRHFVKAFAVIPQQKCLRCHSDPELMPRKVREIYKPQKNMNWQPGKVQGAVMVYIPFETKVLKAQIEGLIKGGVVFGIFLLLVMIVLIMLNTMVFKPIEKLREHAEKISRGEVDEKIEITSDNEIGKLAEAFERMRISIKKVMDLLK